MRRGDIAIETIVVVGIAAVVLIVILILFLTGAYRSGSTISFLQENTTGPLIPKIGEEIGKVTGNILSHIK